MLLRALIHLVLNLFALARHVMRTILRNIPFLRGNQRRYVRLHLPAGLALSGKARQIGPISFGRVEQGAWWAFDRLLDQIAADPSVEGVYYRVESAKIGLADVEAVTRRLDRLRAAGKRIVCFLEQGMVRDYMLATPADTIMMAPPGRLYTFGLRIEMMFLADALEKAGIQAQFVNLGRFKTAAHRFTRAEATVPQQVMMGHLLHGMADHVTERIAKRRQVAPEDARAIFDEAPMSAREARRRGLVDYVVYADQVVETLEKQGDCKRKVTLHSPMQYLRSAVPKFKWRPLVKRTPEIAVLNLKGVIMHDGVRGPMGMGSLVTPKPVVKQLEALGKNKRVKAVVLHIDSPGGSAIGSDIIWRHIRKLAKNKPVIASLGNVAASGGYYIAVAAHEIVAQPSTMTGSIGVIAGKLSGGDLLERLGIKMQGLEIGQTAAFGSISEAMGEREMANLTRDIRGFYRRFLQRVAVGRNISRRRVHRLARGRVYTGERALRLGLVDHLGDLDRAIELACQKVGVPRDKANVRFVDHRPDPLRQLLSRGTDTAALASAAMSDLLPESLEIPVAVALLLREPSTLALMPMLPKPA